MGTFSDLFSLVAIILVVIRILGRGTSQDIMKSLDMGHRFCKNLSHPPWPNEHGWWKPKMPETSRDYILSLQVTSNKGWISSFFTKSKLCMIQVQVREVQRFVLLVYKKEAHCDWWIVCTPFNAETNSYFYCRWVVNYVVRYEMIWTLWMSCEFRALKLGIAYSYYT